MDLVIVVLGSVVLAALAVGLLVVLLRIERETLGWISGAYHRAWDWTYPRRRARAARKGKTRTKPPELPPHIPDDPDDPRIVG